MKLGTKIYGLKKPQIIRRFAALFLCLVICSNFLYSQELTPPNSLLSPIKTFIPQWRNDQKIEEPTCDLPGFGGVRSAPQQIVLPLPENEKARPPSFGSLEFTRRLVLAIYIDGEGYVPTSHPAVAAYLEQGAGRPGANPNIVMVPEHQLAGYEGDESIAAAFGWSDGTRIVNAAGPTLLSLPKQENTEPVVISAMTGWYKQTEKYNIYFLTGDCCIRQGKNSVTAPQAVVWLSREKTGETSASMFEAAVYAEGNSSADLVQVEIDPAQSAARISDTKWFGRFYTRAAAQVLILEPQVKQKDEPAIYHRGLAVMSPDSAAILQVQFLEEKPSPVTSSSAPQFRRITLNNRSDKEANMRFDPYPDNPERGIVIISKGLNLVIEGVTGQDMLLGDIVDISADHAVIWSANPAKLQQGESKENAGQDFEVYLEGNIIFRDKQRTIEASRMYYDAKNKIAYVLDTELTTPILGVKGITGSMRLKAEILQQLGDGMFTARKAVITTSMLGEPTYSLRSRKITLQERVGGTTFFGKDNNETRQIFTAENNYLAAGRVPIFYWPWMAADLKDPTFYIKNIAYGNSKYYGNQVKTVWNPFQLLNVRRPNWLNGSVSVAWFEKRGIPHGADFEYKPAASDSIPVPTIGNVYYWGLYDKGEDGDRLGGGRSKVPFPEPYRYRFGWRHSQMFDSFCNCKGPWQLTAQVSKVSDRNFVNAYFPEYWKVADNETTAVSIKRFDDNSSLSVSSEYSLDKFYTNSNSIPRLDHYVIGKSLLNDYLTWYGHTRVGYAKYHAANEPYSPDYSAWQQDAQYFWYLPWELQPGSVSRPARPNYPLDPSPETIDYSFEFFSTRHELDLPFNLGPIRTVPYALGEFSHWGKDRSGNDVQRLYGQTGVRLDLPFWKVVPGCSSRTWYVNGLAHKINFDTEFAYAQSNRSMDNLILTDSLDSWSIEDFRRRYPYYRQTFDALRTIPANDRNRFTLPQLFDPRYYALRSGLAGNAAASNMEIADDMMFLRMGMTQRFQTKRGPIGKRRIIDWITLGVHFTYFPQEKYNSYPNPDPELPRDFSSSKSIGLIDYNLLWHVGDRFSLFSEGFYDHQQEMTTVGMMWQRPKRGRLGISMTELRGLIEQTLLDLTIGYDMNEKYSVNYTTTYDIKNNWENRGHNFMFIRTGESFRMFIGANYNMQREEWSFSVGIEPVFMRGIAQKMNKMSREGQNMMAQ
ncbi:MAG: hypothetical protein FWE67_01005 [Planctomycetaceae bacterium]|nr:hypothetical protein [Planctomycetaceae bacterium]